MSVAGAIKPVAAGGGIRAARWFVENAAARSWPCWSAPAARAPRALAGVAAPLRPTGAALRPPLRSSSPACCGSMRRPSWRCKPAAWLVDLFYEITDFGTSGWMLVPTGLALIVIAALASPALPQMSRLVLAALAVRLGFVFAAVALPGLVVTIVKRMIGRARPFVGGSADPFLYRPFDWRPDYASLPSGHATNVFAALVAIGLVWPRLRAIMLVYALVIAVSRVVVLSHHPSDVIAGAVAGTVGALLVRDWFAARRFGFAIGADGTVRALPGPSWRRIKKVARRVDRCSIKARARL